MTSGAHDDGELGEVFLKLGKQGSTLAGVMDAFSIAVSIGLQYGVPLETYVSKFTNLSFEPNGLTDDADVRMAKSIMDYIFRRLALDYLSFEDRQALGIYSADERQRYLETGSYELAHRGRQRRRGHRRPQRPRRRSSWSSEDARAGRDHCDAELVETEAEHEADRRPRPEAGPEGGPHLRRAPGEDHRHRRRLPALHDLRHQDAPRRLLLRLRRLRQHQRLQLTDLGGGARTPAEVVPLLLPAAWCEAHHATNPWARGGSSDLADGVLLCSWHHHRAHDPRYDARRLPQGDYRFHRRT